MLSQRIIECYYKTTPNAYIVVYVNESEDPITLNIKDTFPNIEYIYINNQNKNGGLTGTWNQGIDKCFENNCNIIILSNDDILFDNSIKHIVNEAYNNYDKKLFFGPLTNNPGPSEINKILQYSLESKNSNFYEAKINSKYKNINGFFMVFSDYVLKLNKFNDKFYFNPKFKFGGNEVEWFERFLNKKGKPIIVPKTFIYHYKLKSWRNNNVLNDTCIFTINFGNYEKSNLYLTKKDVDTLYFTDDLNFNKNKIIHKCIKNGIIPFYINCKRIKVNNWWTKEKQMQRIIKVNPQNYLPHNYTKSFYVDGNLKIHNKLKKKDIENYLDKYDLVVQKHPIRTNIKDEQLIIIKEKLDTIKNILFINKNFDSNFNDDIGLSETCFLIRNHKTLNNFNKDLEKMIKISIRDQTSFDYLLWKHKINFKRIIIKDNFPITKLSHSNPIGRNLE